jgi:hypothetical protein
MGAGLLAAAASVALTAGGVRARDGRTVLLGCAFSTMTALLAVHGLATPGVLFGPNGVVALAGGASLPVGAAVLALSALPAMRRPQSIGGILVLQAVLAAAVVALGVMGLLRPELVPGVPVRGTAPAVALLTVGLAFYAVLAHRALRTFSLTHRPTDLAVAIGCVWLAVALVPQLLGPIATVGFYLGHLLELAGVALIAVPAALDLRRAKDASRALVGDLSATEVVAAEEAYLGARVRALMLRLGAKDLLHDMGKLSVPTAILRKPGSLDDAEFAAVKRHPEAGVRLLRELGGFPDAVERLVAEHHERLDGSGYPAGLAGAELGIGSRILAVCDVYDALVSDRVYREAWSSDRALSLLREEAGTSFDGACVGALARVLAAREAAEAPATCDPAHRAAAPDARGRVGGVGPGFA